MQSIATTKKRARIVYIDPCRFIMHHCFPPSYLQQGSLEPLIKYVRNPDGDIIARQYCAMCIGNIAGDPDFHEEIVKVMQAIVHLLFCKTDLC